MSNVQYHEHCQLTILPACGTHNNPPNGATWSTLSGLQVSYLPSNWLQQFKDNESTNITHDFKAIIKILDASLAQIWEEANANGGDPLDENSKAGFLRKLSKYWLDHTDMNSSNLPNNWRDYFYGSSSYSNYHCGNIIALLRLINDSITKAGDKYLSITTAASTYLTKAEANRDPTTVSDADTNQNVGFIRRVHPNWLNITTMNVSNLPVYWKNYFYGKEPNNASEPDEGYEYKKYGYGNIIALLRLINDSITKYSETVSSTYLSKSTATSTYLSKSDASSTYLSKSDDILKFTSATGDTMTLQEAISRIATEGQYMQPAADSSGSSTEQVRIQPICYIAPTNISGHDEPFPVAGKNEEELRYENNVSYYYEESGKGYVYPGSDSDEHFKKQYEALLNGDTNEQRKWPLASLNKAIAFLSQIKSSDVGYRIICQWGEYDFGTTQQNIKLPNASGGSTLTITSRMTSAQKRAVSNGKDLESQDFVPDTLVPVKFKWTDSNAAQKWTSWRNYLNFYSSDTICQGVGFLLERNIPYPADAGTKLNTYNVISVKSGQVIFKHCLFKNVYLHHANAENPPTIKFQGEPISTLPKNKGDEGSAGYKLSNIEQYILPCMFYDNEDKLGDYLIDVPFILAGALENSTIYFDKAYVIFRCNRISGNEGYIQIGANNALRFVFTYEQMSKLVFVDMGYALRKSAAATARAKTAGGFQNVVQNVVQNDDDTPTYTYSYSTKLFKLPPTSNVKFDESSFDSGTHILDRSDKQFAINFVRTTRPADDPPITATDLDSLHFLYKDGDQKLNPVYLFDYDLDKVNGDGTRFTNYLPNGYNYKSGKYNLMPWYFEGGGTRTGVKQALFGQNGENSSVSWTWDDGTGGKCDSIRINDTSINLIEQSTPSGS